MLHIQRKRLIFSVFFLMFSLAAIWLLPRVLFLNFSSSIPRGLYLRVSSEQLHVGDIVVYTPTDDVIIFMKERGWLKENQEPMPFLKYVGGLFGDDYSTRNHSFWVNGNYVGEILVTDSKGQPLQISGTHKVLEKSFLPLASNPDGFDGRYTGCVPINRIIAKVIPIWVVN